MMDAPDDFSTYHSEVLDATYDCVDRIAIRAYCPVMQSPGGFRTWWRQLTGSDADLDDNHLMRFAGRLSRRVQAWCKKHHVPVIHCAKGMRKHELSEQHLPTDPGFVGVFLVLVAKLPATVWHVHRFRSGAIDLRRKQPRPFINHYFFHIIDPEWGHITITVAGHPPFNAMVLLNGHEWVERRAKKRRLRITKDDNCFVDFADAAHLNRIADALSAPRSVGRLSEVCARWLYSACLCFALTHQEQQRSGFRYAYSLYQLEYSRNLLFARPHDLDQVFQGWIDRTRRLLDLRTITTIFGWQRRPRTFKRHKHRPRFQRRVETLAYDLTVFKVHFGNLTLKAYAKGERVLRIEAIAHNTRGLNCGVQLDRFAQMVDKLRAMVIRFLNAMRCADMALLDRGALDALPLPSRRGQRRLAGVHISNPRMRAVLHASLALALNPRGFTASELAAQVRRAGGAAMASYTPRQAAYDLTKIRAKAFVERIAHTRRYRPVLPAFQSIAAVLILREKVLKPLIASVGTDPRPGATDNPGQIDLHYRNLQRDLDHLFSALGLAA